jgi:hypothetical protein
MFKQFYEVVNSKQTKNIYGACVPGGEWGGGGGVREASSWSSGREITDGAPKKRAEETPNRAEETHRWAVFCRRGSGVRGEVRTYIVRYWSSGQSAPRCRA